MTYLTSVASGVADGGQTTRDSPSLTVSGTNKVMWIAVPMSDSTPTAPTGVVWDPAGGAQAATKIADSGTFGTYANCSLWRLIAPADATGVVRATWGANVGERAIIVWVETDIDQTTPNDAPVTATGTSTSFSSGAVTTTAGERVVNFGHALRTGIFVSATPFGSPSGTERQDGVTSGAAYDGFAAQEQTASGASTTLTWTLSDSPDAWFSFAFVVNAAGAGPAAEAFVTMAPLQPPARSWR